MSFMFEWNEFADQPHNIAPRSERLGHHLRRWPTYFSMAWADLLVGPAALARYRRYKKEMYRRPVDFRNDMFAVSVSPRPDSGRDVVGLLAETGVRQTLVRLPSWEADELGAYEEFVGRLRGAGFEVTIALLQRREDVFGPGAWQEFLRSAFGRFGGTHFEIGHAWNRTKWGVWDYTEYLKLAEPAFELRDEFGVKLVGPAVIDFEFHLYPPTLRRLPFDKVSSLLYVDRVGPPENAQFGWTTPMKVALFKAVADVTLRRRCEAWLTEVNWPLEGTGRFSPASGRPNVSERDQADFLVRYYVLCLAGGLIERIFWWQLVAPGYGLVDSRESPWRRRPSFAALRTMVALLSGATFAGKDEVRGAEVFRFRKEGATFAVCWANGPAREFDFGRRAVRVLGRDGDDLDARRMPIVLNGSPKYVVFDA